MDDYQGMSVEELKKALVRISSERSGVIAEKKDVMASYRDTLKDLNSRIEIILVCLKEKEPF